MLLIVLEAMLALGVALFFVWWTMFSGRKRDPGAARESSGRDDRAGGSDKRVDGGDGGGH